MSEATVTAIVLKRKDSGENDRRLTVLTRELGKIDVIAKGARKGNSRLAGISEPLVFCQLQLALGKRQRYVTQAQPGSSFPGIRSDYDRLSFGLAMLELTNIHLPYEAQDEQAFDQLKTALSHLGGETPPVPVYVWFAARLMVTEGQMPEWGECAVTHRALKHTPVWVSPAAGGAVGDESADRYADRWSVSVEALLGVQKTAELDTPPLKLKRSLDCAIVVHRFWQGLLDAPLPAGESAVRSLMLSSE